MAAVAVLLCMSQGAAWGGVPQQVRLRWSELDARLANRKVTLALPDGATIQGKVRHVQPDGLRLKVSNTSDRRAHPKGEQVIPRDAVSVLTVTEHRWLGRLLCTIGAMALAGGIVAAQDLGGYEGALFILVPAVAAAGTAGAGVGGYFIGKRVDRRVTEITVIRN